METSAADPAWTVCPKPAYHVELPTSIQLDVAKQIPPQSIPRFVAKDVA
eukprot:SAG11_NODE_40119_length_210_cov_32.981982_1_plen_48_part_10